MPDTNANAQTTTRSASAKKKNFEVQEVLRLHHAYGDGYTDFDNESDLVKWVNEAHTVKVVRDPDGSERKEYHPNAHLVHGASHPDFPNLRVEKVSEVVWPEDDDE